MFSDKDNQLKSTGPLLLLQSCVATLISQQSSRKESEQPRDGDLQKRVQGARERRHPEIGIRGGEAGVKVQVEKQIAQSEGEEELQPKEVQEQEQGQEVLQIQEPVKVQIQR